ncbi:phytanoyl-CoA dioxygenase family protein [Streptomyces sp. SL13]|uniref:Phytanoyl-CoA dioxygenase family protein n=1 Tax=Streptantibioticus silvisoli TaxID=2705255 RepID=A0AA90H5R3_9ACTN|nr:phytanoyl-CoA dioxygenase family protein [Streptantibioticus silvisoli]MDI5968617.1 phytanoyl-CoA dioxygenase family protein [Streptantibioticus silvisoli]
MLDRGQLDEFAERGYVVVPQVVSRDLVGAASRAIDELIESAPPGPDVRGPHFYFPRTAQTPSLAALLMDSPALTTAESLTGIGSLEVPWQAQVALNIPPFPAVPGWHHIDGFPLEADGRPGTFTMLAGVLMSDQLEDDAGNLWVWPGSHLAHTEYFREHGPDAFFQAGGYPPIQPSRAEQVRGRAGDLLLAHYLLGHNIGNNTSERV